MGDAGGRVSLVAVEKYLFEDGICAVRIYIRPRSLIRDIFTRVNILKRQ